MGAKTRGSHWQDGDVCQCLEGEPVRKLRRSTWWEGAAEFAASILACLFRGQAEQLRPCHFVRQHRMQNRPFPDSFFDNQQLEALKICCFSLCVEEHLVQKEAEYELSRISYLREQPPFRETSFRTTMPRNRSLDLIVGGTLGDDPPLHAFDEVIDLFHCISCM